MSEWQPIETAPKGPARDDAPRRAPTHIWAPIDMAPRDGTWIWAFVPPKRVNKGHKWTMRGGQQVAVFWCTRVAPEKGWQPSARTLDLSDRHGGYWSYHPKGKPLWGEPTHWMHLPEPPQ